MDALKYSNYMSQGMGLYGFTGQDGSTGTPQPSTTNTATGGGVAGGLDSSAQSKLGYSAEALSRSYLEQQKSYYGGGGGGGGGLGGGIERPSSQGAYETKSFTPGKKY